MKDLDVVVVGEANLDLLLYGLPETLPPERELLASGMELSLGGSSAITAHNLAALGCRVGFISLAAADAFADLCHRELAAAGVDLSATVRASTSVRTGASILLPNPKGRRTLTFDGTTALLRFEDLDLSYIASARHLHLSSYFLQRALRPDVPRLLAFCKEQGMTVSLDPNDDPAAEWSSDLLDLLRFVDVLMPNEDEACRLAHEPQLDRTIERLRHLVPALVIKQGRRGACVCEGERLYQAPAHEVDLVDAVGAGDSFNAGFLKAFLDGADWETCLRMGNAAGSFSTTSAGGTRAFQNRAAVQELLARHTAGTVRNPIHSAE